MKAIIFAGGTGTRLWPLSRKKSPKQFEKIVGRETMIQIASRKLFPFFNWNNTYISTGAFYKDMIAKQLPKLPKKNIIVEPEMRDVGPAVGLVTATLMHQSPDEPILLLWGSDHLVKKEKEFREVITVAEKIIKKDPNKIIFIGQKPRFPSQNLGYIHFGEKKEVIDNVPVYSFVGFNYRPHISKAEEFLKDGHHTWNLGYFVTTPRFLWKMFKQFAPELFIQLDKIKKSFATNSAEKSIHEIYPQIEKISFDEAILEKLEEKDSYVLSADIGWSDIGAWEALKEALQKNKEDNVTQGKSLLKDCIDSLVYNYEGKKLIVGIDLHDALIVNTKDVLLVTKKTSVPKIKKVVEGFKGTENEDLT